ncbi:MAG: hypothetical protein JNG86_14305, partial [Verrucomicrobiaceae bacterium]|nr:hypothetical protein [Verrucomicrobiaceae bacterium]
GRYKNQARVMAAEIDLQRQEIATLKRKLGDQNVKPGAPPIVTETIAMPPSGEISPPAAVAPRVELPPPSPPLPAEIITDTISTAELLNDSTPAKNKPPRAKSQVKARPLEPKTIEPVTTPPGDPVITPITTEASLPPETPSSAAPHASPLAAIIAPPPQSPPKPEKPAPESLATAVESLDVIPALPELPPAEIKPELDPKLGLVFRSRPARPDDLTAMKGIAKVLEQRLHEFGIYTYQQIASWTEDQIKEFSSRLAFKDRIHREKWVEQAKKLQAEKSVTT